MGSSKTFRFTKAAIAALPAHDPSSRSKCAEYTDTQVPGYKCQVTNLGRRSLWYRYTDHTGRKRAIKLGEFPATSVEEGRARALEIRGMLDKGQDPMASRTRLKEMPDFEAFALKEYLPWAQKYKKSADDDESKLRLYMKPYFGRLRLCDITTQKVQMYLGGLLDTLSPATINRHLALLSKLFKLAVLWGKVEKNPCTGVEKFKEAGAKQNYLTVPQVQRVIAAARSEENVSAGGAIQFLLFTGIRREECLTARWEHVDLERGTLFLPHTKSGRSREVFLNDHAVSLLRAMPQVLGSPWVFPGRDPKRPLNNPRKAFHRILKEAGVEQCRLHDCRHTYASMLVNAGASLYQVQHSLGHASPQTTQRYSHLASQTLRETSQKVSRLLAPEGLAS